MANFTGADVSLNDYVLAQVTNGGTGYEKYISFTADTTLANGEVWVIGRAEAGDGSPEALYSAVDQVTGSSDISHNGDDAIHLVKSADYALVDAAIGDAGDDPGTAFDICGDKTTHNRSLIRKPLVDGAPDWATSAGTDAASCQWTATNEYNDIRDGGDGTIDDLDYSSVGVHTFEE